MKQMEIKVVFDKETINERLHIGWGLSVLIDNKILFDTGEKGEWLLQNMGAMGINPDDIESVIISHDHWDHTGGLESLLRAKKKKTIVYICSGFSEKLKELITSCSGEPVEVKKFQEIGKNIYTTGEIPGTYKGASMPEQAVVLKTENGLSVITGCAHPGILEILGEVRKHFKKEQLFFVMGGFHLLEKDTGEIAFIVDRFKTMKVEKVGPCHCSGPGAEKIFAKEYGENFVMVKAGKIVSI